MQRIVFNLSNAFGRLLRAGRYSTVESGDDGAAHVRKYRRFYAPLLIALGEPLVRVLDTGVRVLPQHAWEERERALYRTLYETSVHVERDGVLILPRLPGRTLAALLQDRDTAGAERMRAIELAVAALVALHRHGYTHGDAMAENVMIDVSAGVARWFDFETVHDDARPSVWRRADDVRALVATVLLRTLRPDFRTTLLRMLDVYGDEEVTALLATTFTSATRRPLSFHLGQAPLSFDDYCEIARLLRERTGIRPI